jgi:lipid-binding SYLF domain-containing protein
MKKNSMMTVALFLLAVVSITMPLNLVAQDKQEKLITNSKNAKEDFIKMDKLMSSLFRDAYAYVIFPSVGKGAVGIGGATGNGVVFKNNKAIGTANMVQVTVGLQLGGQAYREVIFFENKDALDRFENNKLKFAGQASAVAAKEGASTNVKYSEGVMVFTQQKGGLMYEASLGGQKFTFKPL